MFLNIAITSEEMKKSFLDSVSEGVHSEEILMGKLRYIRNVLLAESDWTQTLDSPVDKNLWKNYRQALRDLPSTIDLNNPVFPEVQNG